jgi:hypothetical protein
LTLLVQIQIAAPEHGKARIYFDAINHAWRTSMS